MRNKPKFVVTFEDDKEDGELVTMDTGGEMVLKSELDKFTERFEVLKEDKRVTCSQMQSDIDRLVEELELANEDVAELERRIQLLEENNGINVDEFIAWKDAQQQNEGE